MDYFALVGDDQETDDAYGVIRRDGANVERFDIAKTFEWQWDPSAWKYLNGLNSDAVPISENKAKQIVKRLKSETPEANQERA